WANDNQFGGGGFAAKGGALTVNIGGNATPDTLTVGSDYFLRSATQELNFGSSASTHAVTLQNGIAINGIELRVKVSANSALFSGVLSGNASSGLKKLGAGTLSLDAANTFSGTTNVSAGILTLTNALALQNSAIDATNSVTGSSTAGLVLSGVTAPTIGGLTGTKALSTLFNTTTGGYGSVTSLTLNPGTSSTLSYSGVIANGAAGMSLTKTGLGSQTLTGTNTYTGGTNLSAGTLNFGTGGLGTAGAVTFTGSSTLQYGSSTTTDLSSRLVINNGVTGTVDTNGNDVTFATGIGASGSGALTKAGTGTLSLNAANTYTGLTTVNAGTLAVGSGGSLASGNSLTLGASGTATFANAGQTLGTLTNGGTLNLGASTTLTVSDGTSSGVISGTGGSLTKASAGTLTLSGANSFTGATTVSAGVLNIQNSTALGTTAAGTTVASGAALQLQGDINVGAEALTLSGTGVSNDGALRNISGTNTYAGLVTLGGSTLINSDAGTLTLSNTGTITGAGFNLTLGGAGDITVMSNIGSDIGNLIINGTGSVLLAGGNTFTGTTTFNTGTLVVGSAAGGNWAGNITVAGSGTLKGRGDISGAVVVDTTGTYSPGNSPAIQNIGSLTVNSGSLVTIELDGATAGNGAGFHDKIVSAGAVTLNGGTLNGSTIFSGSSGYLPTIGAVHAVITGSAVTGTFAAYDFASANLPEGITFLTEYTATAVNLYAVPTDYASAVVGLNANQIQIGAALQSLRNPSLPFELDQRTTLDARGILFNGLKAKDAAGLRTAYDQLTPEKLTALAATTFQSASILNSNLQQRSAELRRFGPASVSLNGVATPAATEDYRMETVIEDGVQYQIATAKPQKRFGYFASATGAFAAVDGSAERLGSFTQTGAATAGVDYAVNEYQSVGLVVSQAYADTDFSSNNGSARTATSRLGVFYDYHNNGFFVTTSVSAGFSNYDSKREIAFLNQTASGETQGLSYGGLLATGYDFKVGDYIIGATASLAYDHAQIDGFDETGSIADLKVARQNADSLVTTLGFHVSRPFMWKRIGWVPDVSLGVSRQHYNPEAIRAQFAIGGGNFKVQPQAGGGESFNPGASLSALLPNGWSVRLGYDAILNPQYAEHRINLSVNAGF
ncbi:autotransporter domain-containing protein, partial [Flavobacterium sp.]|uniref:autotransporter domain-containing protein n=1 Tax=Flavobacterium sp. TaxID=239 RepID=UPI0037BEC22C